MKISVHCLLLSALIAGSLSPCNVRAQAPGDEDVFCLDISTAPAYAPSVKPLLDSWRYQKLLGSDAVWRTRDLDNDTYGWDSSPSSVCQEKVTVTEPLSIPQHNWLFTQHINKSMDPSDVYPVSIFVNVSYTFETECEAVQCIPLIQLYYYLSNDIDEEGSIKPSKYTFLANLSHSNENPNQVMQFSTISFPIAPEDTGFYLGILDTGANVTIHRILTYRLIGPMKQSGLTLLPETPAPISVSINITGMCAANSNTSGGNLPTLTLSPTCTWTYIEQCSCIEGHYLDEIEGIPACIACTPGEYKSFQGNDNCLPCPAKSQSSEHGAAACTCLPSFYRSPDEGPEFPCTGPPSFPQHIMIVNVMSSSADVTWGAPDDDGGRSDLFYNISYMSFNGNSDWVYPEQNRINDTHYTLEGLDPCALYFVLVTAENGVTSQAGEQNQRSVGGFVETIQGTPTVTNVEVLEGIIIDWTPLTDDCVEILEYHVQFRVDNEIGSSFITVPKYKAVYEVNITADLPPTGQPIFVVVRANSSESGLGTWSDPVLFVEVNPNAPTEPPTIPTSTTVTSKPQHTSSSSSSSSTPNPTSETFTTIPTSSPTSPTSNGNTWIIVLGALLLLSITTILAIVAIVFVWCKCRRKQYSVREGIDYPDKVRLTSAGRLEFEDGNKDLAKKTDDAEEMDDLENTDGMEETNGTKDTDPLIEKSDLGD